MLAHTDIVGLPSDGPVTAGSALRLLRLDRSLGGERVTAEVWARLAPLIVRVAELQDAEA